MLGPISSVRIFSVKNTSWFCEKPKLWRFLTIYRLCKNLESTTLQLTSVGGSVQLFQRQETNVTCNLPFRFFSLNVFETGFHIADVFISVTESKTKVPSRKITQFELPYFLDIFVRNIFSINAKTGGAQCNYRRCQTKKTKPFAKINPV